jgi:ABC-2 type transport system ATP-binding protein
VILLNDVEIRNLKKKFRSFMAVDDVSFDIKHGDFFAILGPNGAGKSTLMKVMMTLSKNYSGEVRILGYDVKKDVNKIRGNIGIVAESTILYDKLTALENLLFFSGLYHTPRWKAIEKSEKLLKSVEMWEWRDKPVNKFSTGMKQRINIVRSLMSDPEILFLDEPTASLDLQSAETIRYILREANNAGTTIVLTTHLMDEAEEMADRIAIMNFGKLIAAGTLEEIAAKVKNDRKSLKIEFEEDEVEKYGRIFENKGIEMETLKNTLELFYSNDIELEKIIDLVSVSKMPVKSINTTTETLDKIFLKLTDHKRQGLK